MCAWPAAKRWWRSMHALRAFRWWNRMTRMRRAVAVGVVLYVPTLFWVLVFPHRSGSQLWVAVGVLAFTLGHLLYQAAMDIREHREPRLSAVYFCVYCVTPQPAVGEGPHEDWCPRNDGIPEPEGGSDGR